MLGACLRPDCTFYCAVFFAQGESTGNPLGQVCHCGHLGMQHTQNNQARAEAPKDSASMVRLPFFSLSALSDSSLVNFLGWIRLDSTLRLQMYLLDSSPLGHLEHQVRSPSPDPSLHHSFPLLHPLAPPLPPQQRRRLVLPVRQPGVQGSELSSSSAIRLASRMPSTQIRYGFSLSISSLSLTRIRISLL